MEADVKPPRKLKVRRQEVPLNCGADIYTNLGSTARTAALPGQGYVWPTPEEVNEDLECLEYDSRFVSGRGVAEIWINDQQKEKLHDILVGRGYKLLHEGKNPNHSLRSIFLYIKDIHDLPYNPKRTSGNRFG